MKTCKNCAWYCHSEGTCWENGPAMYWGHYLAEYKDKNSEACDKWSFDGLEDWERDQLDPSNMDSLMTVEKTTA